MNPRIIGHRADDTQWLLAACGDYTEQHPEMTAYGIWAGTTGDQRRKARGKQRKRVAA